MDRFSIYRQYLRNLIDKFGIYSIYIKRLSVLYNGIQLSWLEHLIVRFQYKKYVALEQKFEFKSHKPINQGSGVQVPEYPLVLRDNFLVGTRVKEVKDLTDQYSVA